MHYRVLAVLLVTACAGPVPDADSAEAALRPDRRACGVAASPESPAESVAVQCAEAFVVRNGYTDLPGDPSMVAGESIEIAGTPEEVLARRQGSLDRRAAVLCWLRPAHDTAVSAPGMRGPGYEIGFVAPGDTTAKYASIVSMDTAFRQFRMQHLPLIVDAALSDSTACRALGNFWSRRPAT